MKITVGTRGSKLALVQTQYVVDILQKTYPEDTFDIKIIKTAGDREQVKALDAIGTKGVFVAEIEQELLSGEIQLAVHSMKDMPDQPADGLVFSKAWKREDPRDVLILKNAPSWHELREGAVIGTGSRRRAFQLKHLRPDLEVVGIRGNVDTRIRKLMAPQGDEPVLDGIVVAAAGLKRLGRESEITQYLGVQEMIPAPAQGVLALEIRCDNVGLLDKLNAFADEETELAVKAERGFLKAIGGDCHLPVAAYFEKDPEAGGTCRLRAMFGTEDGKYADTVVCGDDVPRMVDTAVRRIRENL